MIRATEATFARPVNCVGVICFRGEDVLLIQRGKAPRMGDWSIPGGRIKPGESKKQAALRELSEETGVKAGLGPKVTTINTRLEGQDYILHNFLACWKSGEPVAAGDAASAQFVDMDTLKNTPIWKKTRDVIELARTVKSHPDSAVGRFNV
ncbi:MAG: NUDIX hydrolase [Hyphomonadaceae bacterium]|nr:NUDIX hydrolase [Hyphomonadaceae bacterium]